MKANIGILFLILKSKGNKNKVEAPIYVRVSVNGSRKELSIGKYVDPLKWDSKSQKVKGKGEFAETINTYLHNYKNHILSTYNSLVLEMGVNTITSDMVIARLRGECIKKEHTLLEAFRYHNGLIKQGIGCTYSKRTYQRWCLTEDRIKLFIKGYTTMNDIPLNKVTIEFFDNFEAWLSDNYTLKHNGKVRYLKQLKGVMKKAVGLGWIEYNPLQNCKSPEKPANRQALNEAELAAIENKNIDIKRLELVRDIFIFSVYTGISYSDIKKLRLEDVSTNINGRKSITIERQKTNTRSFIPLLPKAIAIIEKYKNHPKSLNEKTLLPIHSNAHLNGYLKEIQNICGISKNLTFHIARHTFATTIALSNGVPLETIKTILGHTTIKTTEIYGKMNDKRITRDVENLESKLFCMQTEQQPQQVALK